MVAAPITLGEVAAKLHEIIAHPVTRAMYRKGIADFLQWLEDSGTPVINRSVVELYRRNLSERQGYSTSTVNQRLSSIRKLLIAAAEEGLLRPEEALLISRVSGLKGRGVRPRSWLTAEKVQQLIHAPDQLSPKGIRDCAILAVLVGCGLARGELVALRTENLERRQGRWVLLGVEGKRGRTRTVPVPEWVKAAVDNWLGVAKISTGPIFLAVERTGAVTSRPLKSQSIFDLVKHYSGKLGLRVAPQDLRRTCAKFCWSEGGDVEQIQLLLGHSNTQITERYLATVEQQLIVAPNDRIPVRWQGRARRAS